MKPTKETQDQLELLLSDLQEFYKWPVYRGGRTSESRNSESLL